VGGRSIRIVLGLIGTVLAVAGETVAVLGGETPSAGLLHLAIGLTYLYGGLAIWDHAPENPTGRLMTVVGATWFIGTVAGSGIPVLNELGLALEDSFAVFLLALVLAYPTGHLETRLDRIAIAILAIGATALNTLQLTTVPLIINEGINGLYGGLSLAVMTALVVIHRWLVAPPRSRQDLLPVLVAGVVFLVAIIINLVRRIGDVPDDVGSILIAVSGIAPAAIPIALLIGFYRQSEHRLRALVEATPDRMWRFTRAGRYLDSGADDTTADAPGGVLQSRRLHELMMSASREAALASAARALDTGAWQEYDFSLDLPGGRRHFEARIAPSGPDEVTAIARDFTAQRAADEEVRSSRSRIVEATDLERRRLERDLHDGAQQRLVSMSLALRLLRARLGAAEGPNRDAIVASDAAAAELKLATAELRELARGIHPAILTQAGLGPALTSLADRSGVPVAVGSLPDRRLSPAIEATAYFVVSEALTNVVKYAAATSANVAAGCDESTLRVEVSDDGVGGADDSRGTGIRGLRDRVSALGGHLTVDSPVGQGTLLVAEIPIG